MCVILHHPFHKINVKLKFCFFIHSKSRSIDDLTVWTSIQELRLSMNLSTNYSQMSKSIIFNPNGSKPDKNRDKIRGGDHGQLLFESDHGMNSFDNSTKLSSFEKRNNGQLYENIIITDKGGLMWQRNLEDLGLVIDQLQLHPGTLSSPGGHCKQFENEEVSIRWYSNNGTLTVKGEKAEEIKEKLLSFDTITRNETMHC